MDKIDVTNKGHDTQDRPLEDDVDLRMKENKEAGQQLEQLMNMRGGNTVNKQAVIVSLKAIIGRIENSPDDLQVKIVARAPIEELPPHPDHGMYRYYYPSAKLFYGICLFSEQQLEKNIEEAEGRAREEA